MSELVRYEVANLVAIVRLDSPGNRNALSYALLDAAAEAFGAAADDPAVRAVVLTHTGNTFCSGMDLREAREADGRDAGTRRLLGLLDRMVALPKPIVGRIDGQVRAGGLGLVGACDLVFASASSTFGLPETRLGLAPAVVSLTTLPRLRERGAARYFLTGEVFDAAHAADIGLLTDAGADLEGMVEQVLDALRACSPQGLAATKQMLTAPVREALRAGGEEMSALSARLFGSAEAREGMAAFLERRKPAWSSSPGG